MFTPGNLEWLHRLEQMALDTGLRGEALKKAYAEAELKRIVHFPPVHRPKISTDTFLTRMAMEIRQMRRARIGTPNTED